ncbi:bifunctional diaminohydroxyphosphoribosylaminopyrimidine deaminase/5-amino-6-(5-phosphoribosylamino)uracil reductase RibD [Paenibacillus sp. LHD-117]|uniref:bifunctional diaminohydroxyphosphoribosylaminopyrimidine deaminase/5-amino-6-(5-phosphoribosylamino)uracil reductase RibD n=1 Tax=Paenibacillus sp. LHD-117 TaxID=3071412 RepID=UPI0027DF6221|nr:bifunctional diaminohydroxyphosphoribosylaminopyrimidine deaminase/5-amino-6-(5-phosphoribosylamino)uracil reductase RibD [Paenibacillus sp. LHD-117]MDQ6418286.1 bifunctional diaminohydroxyphosphoribosylaminopyrimidine deaminase/5-amino-6-(5-phosphoribosylamino)uracil reductase RibD [Paenibacillus sp. LHD-117]
MQDMLNDEYYMRLALDLAVKASGQTDINPVVGCVVVKGGRIVGLGAHLRRGEGHAEVHALRMAGDEAEGSTVYVTLEPCSHYGKTPPCCDRIIASKAARVVVAATDPNPQVAGRGIARLRESGIHVDVGLLEEESLLMNEKFNAFITTGMPFVTLKTASTLDGRVASRTGHSQWVTGAVAREQVHLLRHQHQGIMVGIGTVLADDPLLTTRTAVTGLHPVRIVVDSKLAIPLDARVVVDSTAKTIVLTTEGANREKQSQLEAAGVEVIPCGAGHVVDLKEGMKQLAKREISSVLLEGGGKLNGAMLEAELIHKIILYMAPKIIGGGDEAPQSFSFPGREHMSDAIVLDRMRVEMAGTDIRITGYPVYR